MHLAAADHHIGNEDKMKTKRRIASALLALAAAAGSMVVAGNGTAGADESTVSRADQWAEAVIRHNPGAERVNETAVRLDEGVVTVLDLGNCRTYYLCLYEHANYGGERINFYYCRVENLCRYRMSDGRAWNDKVSSVRNAQTATARLYNYDGSGDPMNPDNWQRPPVSQLPGTQNPSFRPNDTIDIVDVC